MPVEKLIERIKKDAERKAEEILERKEEEAEEVRQEIEKEKERRLDEIRKKEKREIETMENRILSQAKLESRKKKMNIREEMIERVFKRARERLEELDPSEYEEYLKKSIKKSMQVLGEDIVIHCNEESVDEVQSIAREFDPSLDIEGGLNSLGGIKATSKKGAEIDFTFEANIERNKKELRKEISEILFPED